MAGSRMRYLPVLCAAFLLAASGVEPSLQDQPASALFGPGLRLAVGRQPTDVVLADVNDDRRLDIVTANTGSEDVTILLGDGRDGFRAAPGSPFRVGRAPYPLALGDVNGDGKLDIVTPDVRSNTITVLAGDGAGRFSPAEGSPVGVAFRPYAVALGDLNGDRRPDIVAGHDDITLLTVLLNDGQGRFRPSPGSPVDIGERGGQIVLADFNHDGRLDLATGTAADHLAVWLGDGTGRFSAAPGSPYSAPQGPWSLAAGDLNGDGKPDLVVTGLEAGSVMVMLGR